MTTEDLVAAYRRMVLIRSVEEAIRRLHDEGRLPGFMHVSVGQEAVPAGLNAALRDDDLITTTHRGHGDMVAKGADLESMLAEIFGRAGGVCRAKGGSMHVADVARGAIGANGIVAAGMPIAVGAALALKREGSKRVVVCYSGDGAIANGASHEALNLAALWCVPVVFVRVNNQYAESTPVAEYQAMPDVVAYARSYGLSAESVDGNDVEEVAAAAQRAIGRARESGSASFLECLTYRWYGHNIGDDGRYRPQEEVARWRTRDPIALTHKRLTTARGVDAQRLSDIEAEVEASVEQAISAAERQPPPAEASVYEDVFADFAIGVGEAFA